MRYGILLAAGSGSRFGSKKQFRALLGVPVWIRSLQGLINGGVEKVVVVVPEDDVEAVRQATKEFKEFTSGLAAIVKGGSSRSASVQQGLRKILEDEPSDGDVVAIHDAARPFAAAQDIERTLDKAREAGGAVLCRTCTDTVKRAPSLVVLGTVPRDELVLAETPQVFRWDWLKDGYLNATSEQIAAATDDSSLMEQAGRTVAVVIGGSSNPKLTRPEDWLYAEWLAGQKWGGERG